MIIDSLGTLIILGWIIHLVSDWLLQNSWQADNKQSLCHMAAWVHSGIHGFLFLSIYSWQISVTILVTHILIDTRAPLTWWSKYIVKSDIKSAVARHIAIWRDQSLHLLIITILSIIAWKYHLYTSI